MDQSHDIYREQLLQRRSRLSNEEMLRVSPPWTWWLLGTLCIGVVIALLLSFFGRIEVNTRAVAILRPGDGVRSLVSQVAGTVRSVELVSGQAVKNGELVLALDAPQVEADALSAKREVELLEAEFAPLNQRQSLRQREQESKARERVLRIAEQVQSLRRSAEVYHERWQSLQSLAGTLMVSRFSILDSQEQYAQAQRQLSDAEQSLSQARQEVSALEGQNDSEKWDARKRLEDAYARLAALELSLSQLQVRAPIDGIVDAVVLRTGDSVTAGSVLGKVVPEGHRFRVTSFLPEKDRAFVKIGDAVRLEMAQLPYGEYGTLGARVISIGGDLASPHQVQDALGGDGRLEESSYQVELELEDTDALKRVGVSLRSGMLMQARFTLRRQRPIVILFEPLKRWLE